MVEAIAGLVKVASCGSLPGIYGSVASGCGKSTVPKKKTACEEAGITIVPGYVRLLLAKDITAFPDPVLGYVAKYTSKGGDGCVAVFRNEAGGDLYANASAAGLVESSWKDACKGDCQIDSQAKELFSQSIESIYDQFDSMDCDKDTNAIFSGRGLGGTAALLAAYDFAANGRKVANTAVFGARAPGNLAFAESFATLLGSTKVFHVTYDGDSVSSTPPTSQYFSGLCQAYYKANAQAKDVQVSVPITRTPQPRSLPNQGESCGFSLAPRGDFCRGAKITDTCYLGVGYEDFQKPDAAPLAASRSAQQTPPGKARTA